MKIRIVGVLQGISASKDEAKVRVQNVDIDVKLQPGTKAKILDGFGRGYKFVDIEVEASNPVVVFP